MTQSRKVKIVSVALFSAAGLITVLTGDGGRAVHAISTGPPPAVTGAPGEPVCATACHIGSGLNESPGEMEIIAPVIYEPGQTYAITVRHTTTDTSRRRWGFQLTVLTAENAMAGTLDSTNNFTQVVDDGGLNRQYIEHTLGGTFPGQQGTTSWTFNWRAPSATVGSVTFYAAGNQANGDSNLTGDKIYTAAATASAAGSPLVPRVLSVEAGKKHLFVMAEGFDPLAKLVIDGVDQKTRPDESNPSTILLGVKSIKKGFVPLNQPIILKIRNSNGNESEEFSFTRQ